MTSSNLNVATITNNNLSFVAPGTVNIIANQVGNEYYNSSNTTVSDVIINITNNKTSNNANLTSQITITGTTKNSNVQNVDIQIPNIAYTKPGLGAYGYNTGFSALVTQFTITATDLNNSNITDFSSNPLNLTLTLPHVANTANLQIYKIENINGINSLINPQPSGYPSHLTYSGGGNWITSLPSLSSYIIQDANAPSGWFGGDPHVIDVNGIKTTLPNDWNYVKLYQKDNVYVVCKCEFINDDIINNLHYYTPSGPYEYRKVFKFINNYVVKYTYMTKLYILNDGKLDLEMDLIDGTIIQNTNEFMIDKINDIDGLFSLTHDYYCPPKNLKSYVIYLNDSDYLKIKIDKFWDDINNVILYTQSTITSDYSGELIKHSPSNNLTQINFIKVRI